MTDPVYFPGDPNHVRFERAYILEWFVVHHSATFFNAFVSDEVRNDKRYGLVLRV